MSDLADFLLARIAEDEAAAGEPDPTEFETWGIQPNSHDWPQISPRRVLAECEAKRLIVDSHRLYEKMQGCCLEHDGREPVTYLECDICCEASEYAEQGGGCRTLRVLAAVYADHPDYRDEWRP